MVDKNSIDRLLKKFRDTGTVNRLTGIAADHARSAALKKMLTWLSNDLVLSQEDTLQTYRMVREILIIG